MTETVTTTLSGLWEGWTRTAANLATIITEDPELLLSPVALADAVAGSPVRTAIVDAAKKVQQALPSLPPGPWWLWAAGGLVLVTVTGVVVLKVIA